MQFIDFSWMPILIPFIIGVNKFKYFSNPLKLLFLFVGYGTVNEISVFFLRHIIDIKNTNPATNIYVLVSFLLMGLYFAFLFDGFIKKKNIFFIIICQCRLVKRIF